MQHRAGSFTQWVFQSEACTCAKPQTVPTKSLPAHVLVDDDDSNDTIDTSTILRVNPDTFPLERYKPIRELGAGGAGSVHLCWDEHLQKRVAVKVLITTQPEALQMFQKEAKITAKLEHANVVSILDFGTTDGGCPYMVLEHVKGLSLESLIHDFGLPSIDEALSIFIQMADALGHGHSLGVYHRDVKTSNVIISAHEDGTPFVHLIDFGVAAMMEAGQQASQAFQGRTIVGTPRYMPPDQALGRPFDAKSEIYSFGCLMYETLSGRVPFAGDDALDLISQHANSPVPEIQEVCGETRHLPQALANVVMTCLDKDPEKRFHNMVSLKETLRAILLDIRSDESYSVQQKIWPQALTPIPVIAAPPQQKSNPRQQISVLTTLLVLLFLPPLIWVGQNQPWVKRAAKPKTVLRLMNDPTVAENISKHVRRVGRFNLTLTTGDMGVVRASPIGNCRIQDSDLDVLMDCKDLSSLDLSGSNVSAEGLYKLKRLSIEELDLSHSTVTDQDLEALSEMIDLQFLSLEGCNISDAGLMPLINSVLSRLNISDTKVTNQGLRYISTIKCLCCLSIKDTPGITAIGLNYLAANPSSSGMGLELTCDDQPNEYFKALTTLSSQMLVLHGSTPIPKEDIACLKRVKYLALVRVPISEDTIAGISTLPQIDCLDLWATGLTDKQLQQISKLNITMLGLHGEKVTNAGMVALTKMRFLERLGVERCPLVSAKTIRQLIGENKVLITDPYELDDLGSSMLKEFGVDI